jgi:hypothetical protein
MASNLRWCCGFSLFPVSNQGDDAAMTSLPRSIAVLVCGIALSAGACRKGPKPLAVKSAAEARQVALGSAVIPNLDRSFDRVSTIAEALSFPFDKAAQRKSFLDSLKAPEALVNALRTDGPMAIVAFPPKPAGKEPEVIVAIQGKSPEAVASGMLKMGQPVATKDDAKSFKVGDETVWLLLRGNVLVASQSLETLVLGAALAMETAVGSEDDVLVLVSPEAVAKSQGTDLKTAVSGMLTSWTASLQSIPGQSPLAAQVLQGLFKPVADRLAEVEQAGFALRLDVAKGTALRLEVSPRKDSRLAGMVGKSAPYKLDTRVVPQGDAMALMAYSPTDMLASLWADLRPLVAKDKEGEEAAKQIDGLLNAWSFGGSGAMAIADKQMQISGIYGMRKESDGEAFLSTMAALMNGAWYKSLLSAGGTQGRVSAKRDKDVLLVSTTQGAPKNVPSAMAEAMKGMGLLSQTMAMMAKSGNFFFMSGKDAAARVRQLATAEPRKPTGLAATAVEESAGADGFFYMDFGQLVKLGAGAMGAGENPMFSGLRLPLWVSYRGGKSPTLEVRVPMELARGVATFVPMLMGLGMGMGGPPPSGR